MRAEGGDGCAKGETGEDADGVGGDNESDQ